MIIFIGQIQASSLPVLDKSNRYVIGLHVDKVGIHTLMFHNSDTGEALMSTIHSNEDKLFWCEILNFNQIMKDSQN